MKQASRQIVDAELEEFHAERELDTLDARAEEEKHITSLIYPNGMFFDTDLEYGLQQRRWDDQADEAQARKDEMSWDSDFGDCFDHEAIDDYFEHEADLTRG